MNNEQQIKEEWYRTKFSTNNGDESARISEDFEMKDAADFWLNKLEEALSHQKAELREKVVDVDLPPFAKDADKETHGAYYQRGYKAAIRKVVALLDNPLKE